SISPSCSRLCRSIRSWRGSWDERHGRRSPPGRQRPASPPAHQEPGDVRPVAGDGRGILRAHHRAHGRQHGGEGMSAGANRNARLAWTMVAVAGGMLGLAYAAVPLYEAFCRATGFAGTPLIAEAGDRAVIARTVDVRFDSNVDPNLAWRFEPEQRVVRVKLGEQKLVYFR